ncbi:hypothetical protein ACLEPN_29600 [Myxococcus sp. 1LA]
MTTTTKAASQSVSPLLQRAEQDLRGQEFITAVAEPEGLRLTGRGALLGRVAILTEDDVLRARDRQVRRFGLGDAAMWALIKAPEPSKAAMAKLVDVEESEESEAHAELQAIEAQLHGHPLFQAQIQGSGLALFADKPVTRTAYMLEAVALAAHARGGMDEVTRLALHALGWDVPPAPKAPIAHVTFEATLDTSQPLAAVNELSAAVTKLEETLGSTAGQLGVLLSVIPVVSGAVAAIYAEGGTAADHQVAAQHLVALVEKARKLALGAE